MARYTPFGDWRTEPGTNPEITDRGYTGHAHNNSGDNDLGLVYMNARYYVPYLNRFASADTIVPDPTNPQSYNRYSYVRNNPIRFIDPTGHYAATDDSSTCSLSDDCTNFTSNHPKPFKMWENNFNLDGMEHHTENYNAHVNLINEHNQFKSGYENWNPRSMMPESPAGAFFGGIFNNAKSAGGTIDYFMNEWLGNAPGVKIGRILPGQTGSNMVATGSYLNSRSEGLSRGQSIHGAAIDVGYDLIVDATAGGLGTLAGLATFESGPGAAVVATTVYIGVQGYAAIKVDPIIADFKIWSYSFGIYVDVNNIYGQPTIYPFGYPNP